ncbi:kinase-like protein [Macrolepiota fuliginosa MF-IS2]|uniref:Kinase-like protein n=1 Tax=Macrolepiota fuliginosa MF-IS2 TaxID=1400762 RepID=A0A9P5X7R3_9AGAR|nr:kinase-like protein [Macrolepiota fuliginosa MF-IS2]
MNFLVQRLLRESRVWSRLCHPHIAPLYGLVFEQDRPDLIMPYYENGDLVRFLDQRPQVKRLNIICEAVAGLEYLHNLSPHAVVHGDIKAHNILVTDDEHACLADFGTSRITGLSVSTGPRFAGTCRWTAPELMRDPDPEATTASDIWAFGMTILQILTGRLPFDHLRSNPLVIIDLVAGKLPLHPPEVDEATWTLLNRCWSSDPSNRPRAETLSTVLNIMASRELITDLVTQLIDYLESSSPSSTSLKVCSI